SAARLERHGELVASVVVEDRRLIDGLGGTALTRRHDERFDLRTRRGRRHPPFPRIRPTSTELPAPRLAEKRVRARLRPARERHSPEAACAVLRELDGLGRREVADRRADVHPAERRNAALVL